MDERRRQRLLARLVRCRLSHERFDSLADLTAAVKDDCAQWRIVVTPDDLSAVYRWLAGALTTPRRPGRAPWPPWERGDLSRAEAGRLLRALDVTVRTL